MNKEITQIQIAWFFSSVYTGNFEEFSLKLKNKLGESKVTQILSIPSDMPNEIPRLILSYPAFNLNVAKNRIDLFFKNIESTRSVISIVNDVILSELSLLVGRIGFVKNFFVDGNIENLKKLLKTEEVEKLNLKEINIRVSEKKLVMVYDCNNIESLSIGFIIRKEVGGHEVKKEGIIVRRDLNTMAEKINENNFKKEEINELIDAFDTESNNFILAKWE